MHLDLCLWCPPPLFQAAEKEVEIAHLQRSIQREQAKVERYENNLLSAQAIAMMLQASGEGAGERESETCKLLSSQAIAMNPHDAASECEGGGQTGAEVITQSISSDGDNAWLGEWGLCLPCRPVGDTSHPRSPG